MNFEILTKIWSNIHKLVNSNNFLRGAMAVLFGYTMSIWTTSLIPAIAATAGAVAGIISAHSAHRNQKLNEQQAIMNQYLGLIKALQDEVVRLNQKNTEQQIRLDQQDIEIKKLRDSVEKIKVSESI